MTDFPIMWVQYNAQRRRAKQRGIPFLLTHDEWLKIWSVSGHLAERGKLGHQYCMSRVGDFGSYEIGNVFIQTNSENLRAAGKKSVLAKYYWPKCSCIRCRKIITPNALGMSYHQHCRIINTVTL